MERFRDKAVLVTGAGSGIGAACVRRLIADGASVAAGDLDQRAADAVLAECEAGDRAFSEALDVTDMEQATAFVAAAKQRFGQLHGLINCAGIKGVGSIVDVEQANLRTVMAVNFEGTVNMCQAYVRAVMHEFGPRAIVNISSGAGIMGVANRLPYVASKFGVSGITRSMSPELGPLGI